jgi:hypothetical protein
MSELTRLQKRVKEILNKKPCELATNREIYEYLDKFGMSHLLPLEVLNDVRELIELKDDVR